MWSYRDTRQENSAFSSTQSGSVTRMKGLRQRKHGVFSLEGLREDIAGKTVQVAFELRRGLLSKVEGGIFLAEKTALASV